MMEVAVPLPEHDLVLLGARVIDPETGLDEVRDVGITAGTITAVAAPRDRIRGRREVDCAGQVLAPGFIDLHSHCNEVAARTLQVCDGVTTALELEAGQVDVSAAYNDMAAQGSPNHYGFSASWALARMSVAGLDVSRQLDAFLEHINAPDWHRRLTVSEQAQMIDLLRGSLDEGALGIGVLLGYCQESTGAEYMEVAGLAADTGTATYTHVRDFGRPDSGLFGASEVVAAALSTGAHMHVCHINSTSTRSIDAVQQLLAGAREQGLRVTSEAYPYGAGSTGIGAAFLHPDALTHDGLTIDDIFYLPTRERMHSADRLRELQATDPAGLVIVNFLREHDPADLGFLTRAMLAPDTAVASDAMPLTHPRSRAGETTMWPIPDDVMTHPRTAGTFSRVLRWYVRELGILNLADAVRRCTLVPAEILRDVAPSMRLKGRVQVGCDADLVVFDPDTVADRATYEQPTLTSTGFQVVIVGGVPVVEGGELRTDVRPGRAVRGEVR